MLSKKVYDIFIGLNQDEFMHLSSLIITLFFQICSVCIMSIFQKSVEFMVWSSTEENYLKSVNQTKEAIEAMETKNRFISMISHEIRNPLNAIKGSIDYLGQMITDKTQLKILENAKIGGEILLNLVNNVLDAAKLRSDKIEIIYDEAVFLDILKKVLTVNSDLLKEKELNARVYLEENLPKTLYVDASRLSQVLMNLVSNAIKFTQRKGTVEIYVSYCPANIEKSKLLTPIRKTIHIGDESRSSTSHILQKNLDKTTEEMSPIENEAFTQRLNLISRFQVKSMTDLNESSFSYPLSSTGNLWEIFRMRRSLTTQESRDDNGHGQGYIKIQISDTGCGISEENQKKLFGMFEQAPECSRLVQGGSGLGLWICKQLCQRMNGDITVYSTIGKGSSFVFYLPLDGGRIKNVEIPSLSPKRHPGVLKALVVDEIPTNLCIHKYILEQQGVKVTTASNGKEAIEKYQAQGNEAYSLVFMDVDMPEMNGLLATLKIREWEIKNKVRPCDIYFVTENQSEKDLRIEFVKKGGNGQDFKCVRKPIGVEEMRLIINDFK